MIKVVRTTKGKGGFYKVEFSNGEKIRVSEDLLVKYRLFKDSELDKEAYQELQQNVHYDLGLQQAMNYISYQLRSEKEVRTYLRDKEIPAADGEKVIARLKDLRLIDDKVYGESYVRTQMRTSDKGPVVVKQQLRQKGIASEVVDLVIHEYDTETQFDNAYHLAEKNLRKHRSKSFKETIQKVRTTLMTKGFTSEVIQLVMDQLPMEKDEDQEIEALIKEGERLWRRHQSKAPQIRNQKIKQSLYQKGYQLEDIQRYLDERAEDEE